jgi:hypothetical protein
MKELFVPGEAQKDPESVEVLRVWIANNQQHISLRYGVWDDPAAWGIFLVDLARHLANAFQQEQGLDFDKTVARIRWGFDAEMNSPTDFPTGGIQED